ncbi:phosphoglucosamine mutase [Rubricella aquisinus]|uniref:Phosphoglucosamine mutase n=1 Tax=Rubricella aquisinus TaxID=2028108 RepID=A0A840X0M7_9RHOB|nr:phosphoglucosamine mutase [Rubricella aquisinus]MBB5515445.1 phosphoglucosamine mutase [Rubricella aquisinus]
MSDTLFGTDGIRGRANRYPMTADMALRVGMAAGHIFARKNGVKRVVIGKDTRRSGYMLETALTAGFAAVGMDTFVSGPLPTPGIGMLTKSMRADLGVMISASHNPSHDNGLKFFGPDGYKLDDDLEAEIARLAVDGVEPVDAMKIGRSRRLEDGAGRYAEFAKTTISRRMRFDGLRVVIDCAHGAAYKVAPEVLWELGAEIFPLGVNPNGYNINQDCGSTSTAAAQAAVINNNADIGICLDGDADRLILIDEHGRVADGDQLMALIAERLHGLGRLSNGTLVATVMSNLGLERHLDTMGLSLLRTKVGDRHVMKAMREGGHSLGGEQSGHIILHDHVTTGDGLIAALQVLAALKETGERASTLLHRFEPVPQKLINVRYEDGANPLGSDTVQDAIKEGEEAFGDAGRLLIRKSGTEPLIRVMGECEDEALMDSTLAQIVEAVEEAGRV